MALHCVCLSPKPSGGGGAHPFPARAPGYSSLHTAAPGLCCLPHTLPAGSSGSSLASLRRHFVLVPSPRACGPGLRCCRLLVAKQHGACIVLQSRPTARVFMPQPGLPGTGACQLLFSGNVARPPGTLLFCFCEVVACRASQAALELCDPGRSPADGPLASGS